MGNTELCEAALTAIAEARAAGHNVLTADIALRGLSEWHVPVIETVSLDPDTKGGDIYPQGEKFAVTRQGLSKLAVAAGVIWSASETKRTDDRKCRDYVSFQAVGGIQKPDGTYTFMKAEYDLDMEVLEEELIEQYNAKAAKMRDKTTDEKMKYVDYCVKRDMIQKRKHKLKLAESGAKDRVIRELLGLKATYPMAQIKQPFVIMRITVRPDYSDKDVKRAMLMAAIGSMTGIYGSAPSPQIGYEEPIDITPEAPEPAPDQPEPPATPTDNQAPFDVGSPGASPEVDFKNSSPEDQVKTLEAMMKRSGYDNARLKKPLDKFDNHERLGFFIYLNNQPDKRTA